MKVDLGYEILETYNTLKTKPKEYFESGEKIKMNKIKKNGKIFINYIQVKDGIINNIQEEVK